MTEARTRRAWVAALVIAAIAALVFVAWRRSGSGRSRASNDADAASSEPTFDPITPARSPVGSPDEPSVHDVDAEAMNEAPPRHTLRDPALRDAIRRRILASWANAAQTPPPTAVAPPAQESMPELDGGAIDPEYIRERIREDFLPLASSCYDSLRSREPNAAGRVLVAFTIIADPRYGGVVDHAEADTGDASVGDQQFHDCVTGSMETMAFRPPPHGGTLSVHYPFVFTADDAEP